MPSRSATPRGVARSDFLWSVTVSLLAAFGMIALAVQSSAAGTDAVIAYAASSVSCAALPVALRHPVVATIVQCVATAALELAESAPVVAAQFPAATICVLTAHVAVVALRHDWRIAVGVWWSLAGVSVLLVAVVADEGRSQTDGTLVLVVLASASLIALFGGIVHRYRVRIRGELAVARRDVEIEQERRAVVEERTRIARELHDVVAHSMSVIHMQATSAPYRLADVDAGTRAEFTAIAAGAKGALGEMRQLLGVLRASDAAPETDPTPGLARLPELVEVTGRYGGPVTLVVEPDVRDVPEVVGTTVYRIVQEALSNVVRHARDAATTVHVARGPAGLSLLVVNTPGIGGSVETPDDPMRARHGVIGMRERVARLGGDFSHGPEPDGGYRVSALLPLPVTDDPREPPVTDDPTEGDDIG